MTFPKMYQIANQKTEASEYKSQANITNIAIIGVNRIGIYVFNNSKAYLKRHEKILGFINESSTVKNDPVLVPSIILGDIQDIKEISKRCNFNKVIIALDPGEASSIHDIIKICSSSQLDYELVSDLYDVVYGHAFQSILKDIFHPTEITFRRIIDLVISIMMFICFLPTWIIIAMGIKLDSAGTVLYSQERVGKNGKYFRIFKFRSMKVDAEKYSGPQLATQNDPRITRIGALLRKTRLDELPQLINVINGDMSLIGPRPERPYFVEKYRREIPFYVNRLKTKPGLTGLAQVEGGYDSSAEDVKNKVKHDLYYIENANSVFLNLEILFKTVWVVITAKGI